MWELYENRLNAYGDTKLERQLEQAKEDFFREARGNPAYHKALRNGVEEEFLITRTDKTERFKIVTFPGKELNIGDYIEVWGEVFLVYQARAQDTLSRSGILWQCNHLFRWQNFNSDIVERWGILDSGVYSTTIRGEDEVKYKNKQFKLILPLDEDTQKLYVDKRIAVDTMYNSNGKKILNVYKITGYDGTGESFGVGGHILYLNLRSDEYDDSSDSIDECICDYIAPEQSDSEPDLLCSIKGSKTIRVGTSRKYSAVFYDENEAVIDGVVPKWSYEALPKGVSAEVLSDGKIQINTDDDAALIGKEITINLTDVDDDYAPTSITIGIIGL